MRRLEETKTHKSVILLLDCVADTLLRLWWETITLQPELKSFLKNTGIQLKKEIHLKPTNLYYRKPHLQPLQPPLYDFVHILDVYANLEGVHLQIVSVLKRLNMPLIFGACIQGLDTSLI